MSPLPGWHSLSPSRLTPPHPGPGRGGPWHPCQLGRPPREGHGAERPVLGVPLHASPESSLPHRPEGRSQTPARPRPSPGKIRRPVPSITQTGPGPASPASGLRQSAPGSLPSHPVLAVRWVRDLPSGLFLGSPLRPWLPGQPASFHSVSLPRGRCPGNRPAFPWDRLLPTPSRPSALRCLRGAGDQQRMMLKGRAESAGETAVWSLGLQDPGSVCVPRAYRGAR